MKIYQIITTVRCFDDASISVWAEEFQTLAQAKNYVKNEVNERSSHSKTEINETENNISASSFNDKREVNWELHIINIEVDPLDEFCINEAKFRLSEFFGITPESISDNLLEDTAKSIRETIDYCEYLYDTIDNNIREVLNKYKEEQGGE